MGNPQKAFFRVHWHSQAAETIDVLFNPTELSFEKSVKHARIDIPGLDTPLLQFIRGEPEKLSLELFFDTTESGAASGATSVTALTDRIYELTKIEPDRHAPPVCEFCWNSKFPGADTSSAIGNQKRNSFKCVVEKVSQAFTLFSPQGVPLRATLDVTLTEYKTLEEQVQQLNRNSPDRSQVYVFEQSDTLSSIAGQHYSRVTEWRRIADENGIDDPRRIDPGLVLTLPPVQ